MSRTVARRCFAQRLGRIAARLVVRIGTMRLLSDSSDTGGSRSMPRRVMMAGHARDMGRMRIAPGIFPLMPVMPMVVTLRRMGRPVQVDRTKILAATEHLLTSIAVRIETAMTSAIRLLDPDIRAAVDEHDVPVGDRRDIDVVRFRHDHFRHHRPNDDRTRRGCRRGGDRRDGTRGVNNRLDGDLSLSSCHAPGQTKCTCDSSKGCSQTKFFQTTLRIPTWVLCRNNGRLKGIFKGDCYSNPPALTSASLVRACKTRRPR